MIVNYVIWYLFVFIGIVWIMVMLMNKDVPPKKIKGSALPSVSVIIPAFNEESTIAKTIKSVLSLDYPRKLLDIIIVNDCSTDKTGKVADSFRKTGLIRIVHNERNRGKGYSLNRGISMSKGELIVCMDADSTVNKDALKMMVPHFEDRYMGAVTPALKVLNKKSSLESVQHIEYIFNVFFRKMLAFLDAIHVTPGAFSVYRKSVLKKIGGFDEDNLTEDMDIALSIHNAGYKIENELGAVSYTVCPDNWMTLFKQRVRWYRGAIHNSIKHSYLLFNKRYGNLGMFYMPFNVMSIFAIVFIFSSILYNVVFYASDFIFKLSLVNWDIEVMMSKLSLSAIPDLVFHSITTTTFLLMMGLGLGIGMLLISFRFVGEMDSGRKINYFFYLLIYPFAIMLFWTAALLFNIFRVKKRW